MANLQTISGSKIYIGLRVVGKGVVSLTDFNGATWTEIGGLTNLGDIGDTQELVSLSFINETRTRQAKGTRTGSTMENTFAPLPSDLGQIAYLAATLSCSPYQFKIEYGAGCAPTGTVTMTIASPGVITWAGGHGLEAGSPVSFVTTGALPTGIVAGTVYYVLAAGLTATTFSVAATPGGTAIATSGTESGTHTATAQPLGQTSYFYGQAMTGTIAGGDANTARVRSWPIAIDSNIVEV